MTKNRVKPEPMDAALFKPLSEDAFPLIPESEALFSKVDQRTLLTVSQAMDEIANLVYACGTDKDVEKARAALKDNVLWFRWALAERDRGGDGQFVPTKPSIGFFISTDKAFGGPEDTELILANHKWDCADGGIIYIVVPGEGASGEYEAYPG